MTADRPLLPAAFLDRDGVINRDFGYVHSIEQFEFLPGAIKAMKALHDAGFQLVVVTNQSGIGRGYYSEAQFAQLTDEMTRMLQQHGVPLAGVFYCPHAPSLDGESTCDCRKPMPGMILEAAQSLRLDLNRSILVGDKASDIDAGIAAGVARCFAVGTNGTLGHNYVDLGAVASDVLRAR